AGKLSPPLAWQRPAGLSNRRPIGCWRNCRSRREPLCAKRFLGSRDHLSNPQASCKKSPMRIIVLNLVWIAATLPAIAMQDRNEEGVARIRVDPGHPWRPPFGLERVGQPLTVNVEI